MSHVTRGMPGASLTMRRDTSSSKSYGERAVRRHEVDDLDGAHGRADLDLLMFAADHPSPAITPGTLGVSMATEQPLERATVHSVADALEVGVYKPTAAMTGGLFLGLGIGGFVDGIFLRQIAHWHNIGSAILPPVTLEALSQNVRWDGFFYVLALALMLIGAVSLWREGKDGTGPPCLRVLIGQMILGWGAFNVVEGIANHVLLELHHIRDLPAHAPLYDWVFLGAGCLLVAAGWLMALTTEADFRY